MNRRILLFVLLMVVGAILLGACARAETLTPSAAPTIKLPPQEAYTEYLGASFLDLFGAAIWSLIGAGVLVAVVVGIVFWYRREQREYNEKAAAPALPRGGKLFLYILLAWVVVMLVSALPNSFVVVPPDKVGVVVTLGQPQQQVLYPGFHTVLPWRDQVALISLREFAYITTTHVETASEDFVDFPVGARTCDGVGVEIPYTIKFRIIPTYAPSLLTEYGSIAAVEERVVKVTSRQVVRQIPTSFSSVAMYTSASITTDPSLITDEFLRELLTTAPCGQQGLGFEDLNEEMSSSLSQIFGEAGLELTFFGVRQPDLGEFGIRLDQIRLAAKDAEIARMEEAVAEAQKLVTITQAQASAEAARVRTVTAAQGEAEARVTLAEANAKAKLLEAEAEAKSNDLVAQSLTPDLLEYRVLLTFFEKWNGAPPQYSGTGNVIPFFQIPTIPGQQP